MSGYHRARGEEDPRRSYYLTTRTERLPYAMAPRPRLAKIQVASHVIAIILMIVMLLTLIALNILAFIIYLNFTDILEFFFVLRQG
jgi:hypothetical protein